ncbi:carbohydrate ABC transporter permease [Robinsoniella sp. RHS]|uniref:carbohydrate ABC transporter permease n=1 Tax=Robinsoniella sp. RHS TaxID=1504536 RepID=UPI0026836514
MGIIRDKKAYAVFLLPALLFYIFAVFYPIEESIRLSFMKWNGIGNKTFVMFDNYIAMFKDKVFYTAFVNNLVYLLIVVVIQLSIGLLFAILLTYMTKRVTLVKTLYYVPCIVTTVAVTQLFRSIYSTEPIGTFKPNTEFRGSWRTCDILAGECQNGTGCCLGTGGLEVYGYVHGDLLCSPGIS